MAPFESFVARSALNGRLARFSVAPDSPRLLEAREAGSTLVAIASVLGALGLVGAAPELVSGEEGAQPAANVATRRNGMSSRMEPPGLEWMVVSLLYGSPAEAGYGFV